MTEPTKVEPTPEEFAKKYQSLCDEMGYRIVVSPQYIARDDGSFSTVLQYTVGALPKKE
jgi:hypothetical protein